MSKKAKSRLISFIAIVFIGVAAAMAIMLISDESLFEGNSNTDEGETQDSAQPVDTPPLTHPSGGLAVVVDSKYLWEYGWQQISSQKPVEIPTTKKGDDKESTEEEPKTYYEVVTNWKGEPVTDEEGNKVTEVHTVPKTVKYTEYVTDEGGERVTDEEGKPVTEIYTQVVTTTQKPIPVTDENGENVTDEDGSVVTEKTTQVRTTKIVGSTGVVNAKHWAQGVTDGEDYVRMKIYIDGKYTVTKSSVMSLTMREKSGLISIPNSLVYNLGKGVCNISPGKKVEQMAYVSYEGDKTVVTLIIPESVRPATDNTTVFKASSTISTFTDENGNYLEEFDVSVL